MTANLTQLLQTELSTRRISARLAWSIGVWFFAAGLLLVAAFLKGYELATQPSLAGFQEHRTLLIAQVEMEGFVGLWMLLGPARRGAWYAATVGFACFMCVALYKAMTGAVSCGCFGVVHVNPWITACLDAVMLAGIWLTGYRWLVSPAHSRPCGARWLVLFLLFLILGGFGAWKMASFSATVISGDSVIQADSSLIVLEPNAWIGKHLPVGGYIDVGAEFQHGKWIVVLYHADCPICREAVPNFMRMAPLFQQKGNLIRVALVEMPPFAAITDKLILPANTSVLLGHLSDTHDWFAVTPVMITITEGVITSVTEGNETLNLSLAFDALESRFSDSPKGGL